MTGHGERQDNGELCLLGLLQPMLALLGPLCRVGSGSLLLVLAALPVYVLLRPLWRRGGAYLQEQGDQGLGRVVSLVLALWSGVLLWWSVGRGVDHLVELTGGWDRGILLVWFLLLVLGMSGRGGLLLERAGHILYIIVGSGAILSLLLALPGVNWGRLWPTGGLWQGELWTGIGGLLSLMGVLLCLYTPGAGTSGRLLTGWGFGCGALAVVLLTFGPVLGGEMGDPFYYILEGMEVPGIFQRGEAVLTALLSVADLVLAALLLCGLRRHGERVIKGRGRQLAGAVVLLLLVGGSGREWMGQMEGSWFYWCRSLIGLGSLLLVGWGGLRQRGGRKEEKEPEEKSGEKL